MSSKSANQSTWLFCTIFVHMSSWAKEREIAIHQVRFRIRWFICKSDLLVRTSWGSWLWLDFWDSWWLPCAVSDLLGSGILNGLSHLAQAGRVLSSKAVLNLPLGSPTGGRGLAQPSGGEARASRVLTQVATHWIITVVTVINEVPERFDMFWLQAEPCQEYGGRSRSSLFPGRSSGRGSPHGVCAIVEGFSLSLFLN